MYPSFLTFIKENALITTADRVLLGVSGGVDSMVLAHLCLVAGVSLGVAHVNYGLRGAASDADEALVAAWCEANGTPFYVLKVPQEAYEGPGSIQMVAREERYRFFDRLCEGEGFTKVATAHTANDNLETVLLNLTKGTGIAGLVGISARRNRLIRPLLFATKEEVYAFAKDKGISWREDATNQKNDYQRNLIRNEVVPVLRQINPNLERTLAETLLRMQGARALVDGAVNAHRKYLRTENTHTELDVSWYEGTEGHLVILSELVRPYGLSFADARDLSQAILQGHPGKLFLSGSHRVNLDRRKLIITGIDEAEALEVQVGEGDTRVIAGEWSLDLSVHTGNALPQGPQAYVAYFDLGCVSFPLKVRRWHTGDYFFPLGMKGKKKVSDFMIDSKIPVTLKKEVLVLECNGDIMWLIGHRMDDRFKITPDTAKMLKIEVSKDV